MLLCFMAWETAKLVAAHVGSSESSAFTGGNDALAVLTNVFLIQSLNIHDGLTWNGPSGSISTTVYLTHFFFVLVLPSFVKRIVHQDLWTLMPWRPAST